MRIHTQSRPMMYGSQGDAMCSIILTPHENIPLAMPLCSAENISAIREPPAGLSAASLHIVTCISA